MYNGIGLPTPRGSGTSGYIQRNLSFIKPRRSDFPGGPRKELGEKPPKIRKVNPELAEHERKRQIEIKLIHLADKLESEGKDKSEIEERVAKERKRLQDEAKEAPTSNPDVTPHNGDDPTSKKTIAKEAIPW